MSSSKTALIVSTDTNYLHRIETGRFTLDTDEPAALGGQDAAPAPFQYYLAALAACTAITLRMYAQRKGWNLGKFHAELALSFDENGKPQIVRILHSDQALSDEQWARLLEIVAETPVTKALRDGAVIRSERGR